MKNTCIVLRNINSPLVSVDFSAIVDCFMEGGFPIDKVLVLPFNNVSALCESIAAERDSSDNIIFIVDDVLLQSLKSVVSKYLERDFTTEYTLLTDKNIYLVCPAGKNGLPIVKGQLLPVLIKRFGQNTSKFVVRLVGAPMRKIQKIFKDISDLSRNSLGYHLNENYGDIRMEILYDNSTPAILVDSVKRIIVEGLSDYIYSMQDESLEAKLIDALKRNQWKISLAESFTGGGVGYRIVSVPGASEVYLEGLNTYSDDAKKRRLGVTKETLTEYGAVSDQTAYEMATGLLMVEGCDVAVSTTGIAGPDSDGSGKPVGLCYIGVGLGEQIYIYKFTISGDREKVTKTAINYALFQALKVIDQS